MQKLIAEIRQRLAASLQTLDQGGDVSPAQRFRLEGLCEAACLQGWKDEVRKVVTEEYDKCTSQSEDEANFADEVLRNLPLWMHRAPVYPTTKD